MIKFSFCGFWQGFNVYDNFLIYPIKEKDDIYYVKDPYKEECNVVFVDYWTGLNNSQIKGNPIIIQYSGEPQVNTSYHYDLLIGHEKSSSNKK